MIRSILLVILGGVLGAAGVAGYITWIFVRNRP